MRRTLPLIRCFLLVALWTGHLPALAQFEGTIETKNVTTDELGRPQEFVMTMWVKNAMARIETRGGTTAGSTMIYRTDLKKLWILNEDEKTYFEITQADRERATSSPSLPAGSYTIKRTNKRMTIAGYECEQFIIKGENEETELWGTRRLSHLVNTLSKALGSDQIDGTQGAVAEVMKRGIYPMRSATKLDGQIIESQEVIRIETKTLDSTLFVLPAGFKRQKAPELMPEFPDQHR